MKCNECGKENPHRHDPDYMCGACIGKLVKYVKGKPIMMPVDEELGERFMAHEEPNPNQKTTIEPLLASKLLPPQKANDVQVGGDHYKKKTIEPWDYIIANNLGFLEGNAIKYITRHKEKNGVQDIDKAIHYLTKLKETLEKREIRAGKVEVPITRPAQGESL